MRSHLINIQAIILMAGLAVSCEKVIEFKGEALDPKIVVYSVLDPVSPVTASISVSHPVFDPEYTYEQIENAEVGLYKDGSFLEYLSYVPPVRITGYEYSPPLSTYISGSHKPVPGSTYRLEVSVSGYTPVVCEASFPTPVPIISVDTLTQTRNEYDWEYHTWLTKIRFQDPPEEDNFYRLVVRRSFGMYNGDKFFPFSADIPVIVYENEMGWIDTEDPLLVPTEEYSLFGSDVPNTFSIFSDELISGKEYELAINISQSDPPVDTSYHEFLHIKIELQSISRDLYMFLLSYEAHSTTEGAFFTEPVMVYSNVENGLGVFGTSIPSRFAILQGSYPDEGVMYITNTMYDY
jgi:hypothetical protein